MRLVNYAVKQTLSRDVIITKQEFFKKGDYEIYSLLKDSSKKQFKASVVWSWRFCGKVFYLPQTMQLGFISIAFVVRFLSTGFLKIEKRIILYL